MDPCFGLNRNQVNGIAQFLKRSLVERFDDDNIISIGIAGKVADNSSLQIPSISIQVHKKKSRATLKSQQFVPSYFNVGDLKIDTDIVEFASTAQKSATNGYSEDEHLRTKKLNPIQPGISIGKINSRATGTLGAIVFRKGIPHVISNHHVLGSINSRVIQPGRIDCMANPIECLMGRVVMTNKQIDISVANIFDREIDRRIFGLEKDTVPTQTAEVCCHDEVVKSGRGSNVTYGKVEAIKTMLKGRGGRVLTNQFIIKPDPERPAPNYAISANHDSGSPWLKVINGRPSNIILGIHVGGDPKIGVRDSTKGFAHATEMVSILKTFDVTLNP